MDKLIKIAQHYKFEKQSRKLAEECAELIQAVNKYYDYTSSYNKELIEYNWKYYQDIVEEIADVQIMIDQIMYLLNINNEAVNEIREKKIARQLERIKNEKEKEIWQKEECLQKQ